MNFRSAIRTSCSCFKDSKLPYSITFSEKEYWEYISVFRNDLPGIVPVDYVAYYHKHEDIYYHTTSREIAEKIKNESKIIKSYFSDNGSVGQAIYTYPAKSGRCQYDDKNNDVVTIKFKCDSEHFHIVGTVDSICNLGECVFIDDELDIYDVVILDNKEIEKDIEDNFCPSESLIHYFGIDLESDYVKDEVNTLQYTQLKSVIEKSWKSLNFKEEFYKQFMEDFSYTDVMSFIEKPNDFGVTSLFN